MDWPARSPPTAQGSSKHALSRVLATTLLSIAPTLAFGQGTNLSGPVSLVVPYPAGGPSDLTARVIAPPLSRVLGLSVVVENISGATGGIAVQKMLSGAADGRFLYQGSQNELILPPLTIRSVRYKTSDYEIVHPITTTRLVLVVRKGLPANTLEEFVALSRQRASSAPLNYGSPRIGSLYHLISDSIGKLAGAQYTHVPYKGAAPLTQDLIGDRLDFTVMAYSKAMMPSVQAGHYRIIANVTRDKPADLAHLPGVSDLPGFSSVDYASNAAYYVRKGTPAAIRAYLNDALGNALATAEVKGTLEADGRRVARKMTIEQAEAFYREEVRKYEEVIRLTGFQPLD